MSRSRKALMSAPSLGPHAADVEALVLRAARLTEPEIEALAQAQRRIAASMEYLVAMNAAWRFARKQRQFANAQRASSAGWHAVPSLIDAQGKLRAIPAAADAVGYAALALALGPGLAASTAQILQSAWATVTSPSAVDGDGETSGQTDRQVLGADTTAPS